MNQWQQNQQQQQQPQQQQQQGDMFSWFGLWKNTSRNGNVYLSGTLNGMRVLIFPNGYKEKENQPDYIVYAAPNQRNQDGQGGGQQQQQGGGQGYQQQGGGQNYQQQPQGNWQQAPGQPQYQQQQQPAQQQPGLDDEVPF